MNLENNSTEAKPSSVKKLTEYAEEHEKRSKDPNPKSFNPKRLKKILRKS